MDTREYFMKIKYFIILNLEWICRKYIICFHIQFFPKLANHNELRISHITLHTPCWWYSAVKWTKKYGNIQVTQTCKYDSIKWEYFIHFRNMKKWMMKKQAHYHNNCKCKDTIALFHTDVVLLGCDAVCTHRQITIFQRNILSSSSCLKCPKMEKVFSSKKTSTHLPDQHFIAVRILNLMCFLVTTPLTIISFLYAYTFLVGKCQWKGPHGK